MLSRLQQIALLLALLLGIVVCSRAAAQEGRQGPRLASREEGEAIALAALQHWPQVHDKPDCSHLVHEVYGEAGLDYEYAPTNDIFDGIDRFARVQKPQPGDLVVWQGHVGIVIDPDDTSFYSSVISGFSVSSFTSAYWVNRGPRRFYRYMINGLQSARLLDLFRARRPHSTAHTTSATYEPKFIVEQEPLEGGGLGAGSTVPRRGVSESLVKQSRVPEAVVAATNATVLGVRPSDRFAKERPTREAIRSSFVQLSDTRAQEMQQSSALDASIEIVESFELTKVEIQGLSGWAEFKVRRFGSFVDGKMKLNPLAGIETIRFKLLRQSDGWILVDSATRTYLLRRAAIAMFAGRLASLSKSPENEEDLKPLRKALGMLLADRS
jgi:hypothetical protein